MTEVAKVETGNLRAILASLIERAERTGDDVDLDVLVDSVLHNHRALLETYGEAMARKWVRGTAKDLLRDQDTHISDEAPTLQLDLPGLDAIPRMASVMQGTILTYGPTRLFKLPRIYSHRSILETNRTRIDRSYQSWCRMQTMVEQHPGTNVEEAAALTRAAMRGQS